MIIANSEKNTREEIDYPVKEVTAEFKGFTPVFDCIVDDLGLTEAAVFGVIWRYCQMPDGVCWAAQATIADRLGLSRITVSRAINKLIKNGYLVDVAPPGRKGMTRTLADSGKAKTKITIEAVKEIDATPHQNVTTPHQKEGTLYQNDRGGVSKCYNPPIKMLHKDSIKKDIKKEDSKKPIYTFQKRKTYDEVLQEKAADYRRYLNSKYAVYGNH